MSVAVQETNDRDVLRPVADDWSGWIISGRVRGQQTDETYETAGRTPALGIQDGVDAERVGYRRIYISPRMNLKEAGTILGAVAAKTSRLEIGTGFITPGYYHPIHAAALGATMQAAFGPRFILGVGRGAGEWFAGTGYREVGYTGLCDYVDVVRRLWRGETVSYDGPAGRWDRLELGDVYEGPPPQVWIGGFGLPKFAEAAARSFDAALLHPFFTPEATHGAVTRMREACERIGRDPASLRIIQPIVTAPELDEFETRSLCHARAVTYFQIPRYGESLCNANGWDHGILDRIRSHTQISAVPVTADFSFHRVELMEVAKLVPDEWMRRSAAIGSVDECLRTVRALKEAGADEIATYGSTPGQNARLIEAWRRAKAE